MEIKETTTLEDILKNAEETNKEMDLQDHIKQSKINTDQEILDVERKIDAQSKLIRSAYQAKPFSIIVLDGAQVRKTLLEDKYKRLKKLRDTLFAN